MEVEGRAKQLANAIKAADTVNELIAGSEIVVEVNFADQIPSKVKDLKYVINQIPNDESSAKAKKIFEDRLDDILKDKEKNMDDLNSTTDLYLQNLVYSTCDELDALFESISNRDTLAKRAEYVKIFIAKNPEFSTINTDNLDYFASGAEGSFYYNIFLKLDDFFASPQFEKNPRLRPQYVSFVKKNISLIGAKNASLVLRFDAYDKRNPSHVSDRALYDIDTLNKDCSALLHKYGREMVDGLVRSLGSNILPILFTLKQAVYDCKFKIRNPIEFARKIGSILEKSAVKTTRHIPELGKYVSTEEDFLKVLDLDTSKRKDFYPSSLDMVILLKGGHLKISDLTPENYSEYKKLDLTSASHLPRDSSDQGFGNYADAFAVYDALLQHFTLDQLTQITVLGTTYAPYFASFLVNCRHLLHGAVLSKLIDKWKTVYSDPEINYYQEKVIYLSAAKNWDEAFEILKVAGGNANLSEKLDVLLKNIPHINDKNLHEFRGVYYRLFQEISFKYKNRDRDKADKENYMTLASRKLIDVANLKNTNRTRIILEKIDPVLLKVYDEERAKNGYSNKIETDDSSVDLKIGNVQETDQSSKLGDRDCAYLAQRALAYLDQVKNVDLSSLKKEVSEEGGVKYEKYYDGENEVLRSIILEGKKHTFGLYYSKTAKRNDSPFANINGTVLEVTGSMVKEDKVTPTDLLITAEGRVSNSKIHPAHDGVIIIDTNGKPSIQHIDSIDGAVLGLKDNVVDGRNKDRDKFAAAITENGLSIMQHPLVLKDGKPLAMTSAGMPWYKRAFVKFKNGEFGFVESRKPMDNFGFLKFLVGIGIQDAVTLDTGCYDNYKDINGENRSSQEFNPIMMYVKRK